MSRRTTAVGLHAAAVLYTGGTLAHLLKLALDFSWLEMPFVIDWIIVLLGSAAAITLAVQTRRIAYRGSWERVIHFLIIVHLGVSVVMHLWTLGVRSHEMYAGFPREYSYFALLYFGVFAWRSWTVRLLTAGDPHGQRAAA